MSDNQNDVQVQVGQVVWQCGFAGVVGTVVSVRPGGWFTVQWNRGFQTVENVNDGDVWFQVPAWANGM